MTQKGNSVQNTKWLLSHREFQPVSSRTHTSVFYELSADDAAPPSRENCWSDSILLSGSNSCKFVDVCDRNCGWGQLCLKNITLQTPQKMYIHTMSLMGHWFRHYLVLWFKKIPWLLTYLLVLMCPPGLLKGSVPWFVDGGDDLQPGWLQTLFQWLGGKSFIEYLNCSLNVLNVPSSIYRLTLYRQVFA